MGAGARVRAPVLCARRLSASSCPIPPTSPTSLKDHRRFRYRSHRVSKDSGYVFLTTHIQNTNDKLLSYLWPLHLSLPSASSFPRPWNEVKLGNDMVEA